VGEQQDSESPVAPIGLGPYGLMDGGSESGRSSGVARIRNPWMEAVSGGEAGGRGPGPRRATSAKVRRPRCVCGDLRLFAQILSRRFSGRRTWPIGA